MPYVTEALSRRQFFGWAARGACKVGLLAGAPALLAACGEDTVTPPAGPGTGATSSPQGAKAIVGDVLDFSITPRDWEGPFGWVKFQLHRAFSDGSEVFFIRTDTSDETFARENGLVFAPKLASLVPAGLTGSAYLGSGDAQPPVLSAQPGSSKYTPAWRVHRIEWTRSPRVLRSVAELDQAKAGGDLTVEETGTVMNAAVVKWSAGEMPVDRELKEYLGGGQLVEPVDAAGGTVTFKLHECFPGVRYIVLDTSMAPMAEGMRIVHSPSLEGSHDAVATGRTNVFMNGIKGPGPMGFQPSVFDSAAGAAAWSPYWDHMTYAWQEEGSARVLTTEQEVHAARDGGELDEFPGTPDTKGTIFTVNCPVPVLAPNTFRG